MRILFKPLLAPRVPLLWQRRITAAMMSLFPKPSDVHRLALLLDGIETEQLLAARQPDTEQGSAVLYWHGGGYAMGSPATHRSLTMRLAAQTGLPVIVPRYRLAPEHPYPAQLDDALRCLDALERDGSYPDGLFFAGDSAGGNLALTLALYCKDHGRTAPRGLVLISPWVDVLATYDDRNRQDALLSAAWIHQLQDAFVPKPLRATAFVSAAQAPLRGMPPTLLQFASDELLAPEIRALGNRMRSAGVAVTVDEAPGLWHDYQLHAGLVPEANRAIERIAAFVKGLDGPGTAPAGP
ncbi:alpha/beta hydrolase [Massilia sp. X63]|jgi:acetyl esterase/lipase|uniref:alpha/beta hydrolase n=1 Tax=Massilia sp. X63 TaxID=3237285 RepID=UPI0034DD4A42